MDLFSVREPVNAWTHGAWMLLCIPAGLFLQWQAGRCVLKQIGFAVFTLSLVSCFLGSWLYHAVGPEAVELCARLDYMGIFLLIAGTTTPVVLVVLDRVWRWGTLAGIWSMAGVGILLRSLQVPLPDQLSTGLYILMGWTTIICYCELARRLSSRTIRPLWVGGLIYSIGAIINAVQWPILWPGVFGSHELFHCFVMVASFWHFRFMLRVVARFRPAPIEQPDPVPSLRLAAEQATA